MIWIRVRGSNKHKGIYGEVKPTRKKRESKVTEFYDMMINTKLNKKTDVFFATLLHEFIHIIFFMLETGGVKVTGLSEHKFIEAMEKAAKDNFHILKLKRGSKK